MTRLYGKFFVLWLLPLFLLLPVSTSGYGEEIKVIPLTVYKDPNCGCCGKWVEHIEQGGFSANVIETSDLGSIKLQNRIPPRYQSCHTAITKEGGYVFEGHIPAAIIARFLKEKPEGAIGLAVPGMPAGSPGMEMGTKFEPHSVLLLKQNGESTV